MRPTRDEEIEDDRLRLIFTCCHPALPPEGQVALTLREVCSLTTEEIARAFLVTPATLAQRIVRAKAVIRDKAIPYQVPVSQELSARLGTVLLVVYLIFNEGYSAETTGAELSREAIRLGRLLLDLLPGTRGDGPVGAHAAAGVAPRRQNLERRRLDLLSSRIGRYGTGIRSPKASRLQKALFDPAASGPTRCRRPSRPFTREFLRSSTDWRQITLLYDQLLRIQPSPVVELNRAVAVAMCEGPEQGLGLIDELLAREQLADYHLAHSARADLCRRLGRIPEARASYEKALALARQEPDRRFLARRLEELK